MAKNEKAHQRAVYAGTFDPITNGHQDIIVRAASIFDEVIVAVVEESKKRTLFTGTERVQMVRDAVALLDSKLRAKIRIEPFSGLLVDYVRAQGCQVVVRGLRAVSDYEYEAQMAIINRHLAPEVETVFLMTSDHVSFISSSVVREIARNRGDVTGLVPPPAVEKLQGAYPP